MILKDISFNSPEENIFFDEVLLSLSEQGKAKEVLRFWECNNYAVVLGLTSDINDDVYVEESEKNGIPIIHRASGGGTVLLGKGCLNYSLILSKERKDIAGINQSYGFILGKIVSAFKNMGVDAQFLPLSDIALVSNNKKVSGNAQKRGRNFILHHGTILYDMDISLVEKYLKIPKQMPDYRKNRKHSDFISNVDISPDMIKKFIIDEFDVENSEHIKENEKNALSDILINKKMNVTV